MLSFKWDLPGKGVDVIREVKGVGDGWERVEGGCRGGEGEKENGEGLKRPEAQVLYKRQSAFWAST